MEAWVWEAVWGSLRGPDAGVDKLETSWVIVFPVGEAAVQFWAIKNLGTVGRLSGPLVLGSREGHRPSEMPGSQVQQACSIWPSDAALSDHHSVDRSERAFSRTCRPAGLVHPGWAGWTQQ